MNSEFQIMKRRLPTSICLDVHIRMPHFVRASAFQMPVVRPGRARV
jgi:hypothetical protein